MTLSAFLLISDQELAREKNLEVDEAGSTESWKSEGKSQAVLGRRDQG